MADLESRIRPLAVKKANVIGPRTNERLASMGITTVGEFAAADPGLRQEHFGRAYASWLARISRGRDERAVVVSPGVGRLDNRGISVPSAGLADCPPLYRTVYGEAVEAVTANDG